MLLLGAVLSAGLVLHCTALSTLCLDPRQFGAIEGNPGGVPGPHWQNNTLAIQKALDMAGNNITGSSCVRVSGGDFVTADLFMRSNSVLIIESGSRLLTAINKTKKAILLLERVQNATISGGGVLYGKPA